MSKDIILYKFNDRTQGTEIVDCKELSVAHAFYALEYLAMQEGRSDFNYMDMTVDGRLLRSYSIYR